MLRGCQRTRSPEECRRPPPVVRRLQRCPRRRRTWLALLGRRSCPRTAAVHLPALAIGVGEPLQEPGTLKAQLRVPSSVCLCGGGGRRRSGRTMRATTPTDQQRINARKRRISKITRTTSRGSRRQTDVPLSRTDCNAAAETPTLIVSSDAHTPREPCNVVPASCNRVRWHHPAARFFNTVCDFFQHTF